MSDTAFPDNLREIAAAALAFTEAREAMLPAALIRYQWCEGSAGDVAGALATYQNTDGGFGNQLEPDIHAPESNPFAVRIAMQYLQLLPREVAREMRARLREWLIAHQHEDGDWHFSDATKAGFLQPWFAAWEFPSLNPACCVVGLANSLELASPEMLSRATTLFAKKASLEQVSSGGFYDLLPYVEYSLGVTLPTEYTEAIATSIVRRAEAGEFEDAEHFFTLAFGGAPEITAGIPGEMIARFTTQLLGEQQDDGGWPTPYDDAWRVWTTANAMAVLARLSSSR